MSKVSGHYALYPNDPHLKTRIERLLEGKHFIFPRDIMVRTFDLL